MARLTRQTLKVFAQNATNNGVFGSAQDTSKIITSDVTTLQSKAAWLTGWLDAIIGTKRFPPVEEFQSVQYVHSYMTAYLMQEGIAEYDSGTTYYENSIVRKSGTYELYGSLIYNNVGNALPSGVSDSNWQYLQDISAQVAQATESVAGIAEIATAAEVNTGTDDMRIVTPLKLKPHSFVTGDGKETWLSTLQAGWVWADGKTIGNASSNATSRANADTLALFTALWNETDYAYTGSTANELVGQLQVYSSAGAAVDRGASAAADWAANCSIALIDKRGRASFGKDNMGGTPAGRLTGQPGGIDGTKLGGAGGEETHTLVISEIPSHSHTFGLYNDTSTSGGQAKEGAGVSDTTKTTSSAGGGGGHNTLPPGKTCNYMIKL